MLLLFTGTQAHITDPSECVGFETVPVLLTSHRRARTDERALKEDCDTTLAATFFRPIRSAMTKALAESDIRFLEYRLEVIGHWPPSPRKQAATEAISRRLASIARTAMTRTGVDDLLAQSCRLLDDVFVRDE